MSRTPADPLRIALVIERYAPEQGGAEKSTAQIAQELARRGHEVCVIAGRASSGDHAGPVRLIECDLGWSRGVIKLRRFARRARQELDRGRFDVTLSLTLSVPAAVVQPRAGVLRELHERIVASRRTLVGRSLKRALLALHPKQRLQLAIEHDTLRDPSVRRVIAISRYMAQQLQRHHHVEPRRIELIPNASEMPEVSPEQRRLWRGSLRSAWHLGDRTVAYLFAALDPRRKGVGALLTAADQLRRRGCDFVILLAGSGMGYPEVRRVADLGLRDHVRFIGATRRMPPLYAASDVCVLPTHYDPASKVVIEALMMGLPAISTVFNGASDFITPPDAPVRGRVLTDPSDAHALAQAMLELADPLERQRCSVADPALRAELSMARHVDALERVLIEAANPPTNV